MRFEDLSPQDQNLLNTDFGAFDKVAEDMVKEASECYERGYEKTALEIADNLDKVAEEEEKEEKEEKKMDEASEKKAEQLGAFYERGVFDGLSKLGEARHGDALHYLWPFIEEKIAEGGARAALAAAGKKMLGHIGDAGKAMHPKAVLEHGRKALEGQRLHSGTLDKAKAFAGKTKNPKFKERAEKMLQKSRMTTKERAIEGAKGGGKVMGYLAGAGAAGAGVHAATKKD